MRSIQGLLSCLLLLSLLVGCGRLSLGNETDDEGSDVSAIQAPQITLFEAAVSSDSELGETVLSWEVSGTTPTLSISPEPGTVTGTSVTVTPAETTTYTLTATNNAGKTSRDLTINIGEDGSEGSPAPPADDPGGIVPAPPDESPSVEPLALTGTWRLTANTRIYNNCPLDWLFKLKQEEDELGTVLTGSYGYGRDDPNPSDPLLTCSGTYEGTFDPALEGRIGDDGTVTLTGDYIYGADYTGAPPEDEDHIILKATATSPDTLTVNLEAVSTGGGGSPFDTTATMQRVSSISDPPVD